MHATLHVMNAQLADQAAAAWTDWHERRLASVAAPNGPLALTGTHWIDDLAGGAIPGLPGRWHADGRAVVHEAGGGWTRLAPHDPPSSLPDGRTVRVIEREGLLAVRVWDPKAAARAAFTGIATYDHAERWAVPGAFRSFPGIRPTRVPNADGRERTLVLDGELSFTVDGGRHTLAVAVEDDGRLWAVLSDATSGRDTFRFRFLYTGPPAADGTLTVDFNRLQLPPCAFADGFVCPFPPPGNVLPFAVDAGERAVLTR